MRNMLALLVLSLVSRAVFAADEKATPYHRLFQGYRFEKLSPSQYLVAINGRLLPHFAQVSFEGLLGYRIALPRAPTGCVLPDELGLLTFSSEKDYLQYRRTPIARKISDVHADISRPEVSRSFVPQGFQGVIEPEKAYVLKPKFEEFAKANAAVFIHCGPKLNGEPLFRVLEKIYGRETPAKNLLFAVFPDFLVEYAFVDSQAEAVELYKERTIQFIGAFQRSVIVSLPKKKIQSAKIGVGEGMDAQWVR